jgi:hypothetical protein
MPFRAAAPPGVVHIKVDSQGSRIVEIPLRLGPGQALSRIFDRP